MAGPRRLAVVGLVLVLITGFGLSVSGQNSVSMRITCGTPAASPGASPPGSPAATPVASPVASPAAECATPVGSPAAAVPRLDLAAMALDVADLPAGYERKFEGYVPGDHVAALVTQNAVSPAEIATTGLRWYYVSSYEPQDGSSRISTYLEEYAQPAGAVAGFNLLENEQRLDPGTNSRDLPGPGVGEQPQEITVASASSGGQTQQFVEATFRLGRLVGGVSVVKAGSSPDLQQIKQLAAKLEKRMQAVVAGQAPAGVDLSLPSTVLPIDQHLSGLEEGYLTAGEAVISDPAGATAKAYRGGYERIATAGPDAAPAPYVYLASWKFASPAAALAALNQADGLNFPITGFGDRVKGVLVSGTDAATAFTAAVGGSNDDSFIIVFVKGDRLGAAGVLESTEAEPVARDLAAQQAACLAANRPCTTVTIPAGLARTGTETPAATAVSGRVNAPDLALPARDLRRMPLLGG